MASIDLKKLRWQCRRGMLELDVILIPFLEKYFDQLDESEQVNFEALLTEADPDLYTWLMGYGECDKKPLKNIIQIIRRKMEISKD